ncbi:hypothetical protein ACHAWF_006739 [Thalassiosira exigua]
MDRSPSSHRPSASRFVGRTEIRRAVFDVIRRVLLAQLSRQEHRRPRARARPRPPPRLTKAQRARALHRANVIEDVLYRRACSLAEYQDAATLERRVVEAGRMVRQVNARRREAAEARRRMRGGGGGDDDGVEATLPRTAVSSRS